MASAAAATIKPHKIQRQALRALEKNRRDTAHAKSLTVLPSGMGKTHLAAFDAKRLGAKRILFIAHKLEIIEQAESIFASVYGIPKGRWNTGFLTGHRRKDYDCQMTFATIQTLAEPKVLDEISKIRFDYVVLDEYHHSAAETYQRVLNAIQYSRLGGFTATPFRLDGKKILPFVDNNVAYSMELEEGIKSKELVPFHYHALYDNIDYSDIRWGGYKYRECDLNKKLIIDERDNQILKEYKDSIQSTGRRSLMFCVSVKHTERMATKLQREGITAEALTYVTPMPLRQQIVSDFRAGKIDVLCIRDIFNEGIDFPEVSAIMLLRPTVSRTVFYQQLGRGLRKAEGKQDVLVYDFVSNYHNAYKIKEWLSFAKQTGVKHSRVQKPSYHHNIPSVYFDKKVIEIFELQKPVTNDELIQEYLRVSKAVGFHPTHEQFRHRRAFYKKFRVRPKYSEYMFVSRFGGWDNFIRASIGEAYLHPRQGKTARQSIPIEEIETKYRALVSKLGHENISWREWITEYGYAGISAIKTRAGNWGQFKALLYVSSVRMRNCVYCKKEFDSLGRNGRTRKFCSSLCITKHYQQMHYDLVRERQNKRRRELTRRRQNVKQ